MAASTNRESRGEGLDTPGGDGPLDESGRPEWSAGDVGAGGVSTHHNGSGSADGANVDVFKTVEWYGTIRLLVFVRKGQCRWWYVMYLCNFRFISSVLITITVEERLTLWSPL